MTIRITENVPTNEGFRDIIFDNNTEIGYCVKTIRDNDHLWITDIVIYPQFRRQGYGRQVITEYENIARNHNCNKIECEPIGESVSFWAKVGFSDVGRRISGIPPSESDPIFQKII